MWWSNRLLAVALLAGSWLPAIAGPDVDQPSIPESLGQWYKPQNQRQVWLHTMFAMRRELQAVREYAAQQDAAPMAKWAQALGGHYRKLPEMVPEWADEVDLSLLDDLLGPAAAGRFDETLRAVDRLERDCRSCHREHRALAALKYRWPRFQDLEISDGSQARQRYTDFMEAMSTQLNRLKIASEDARWTTALTALDELQGQLEAIGSNCAVCHDDAAPRERILGSATRDTLKHLRSALQAEDTALSGRLLGEAAVQVCARCHGIHRMLSDVQRQLFR